MESIERTLILCIDGDNDVGIKGGAVTPIIGREKNIRSATSLALSDPEEADANAMFGAVRLYDRLRKENPGESFEVATIAGSQVGGVDADRKMVKELREVLGRFDTGAVIIVTDGYADESLVPVIQSHIPIHSIHHVVVKHSERLEETWAVFFRYMKMLVEDPYYSRITLGVPGIILVILGFLLASNQLENAGMVVVVVMGVALFLKGFGLDEKLADLRLRLPPPERQLTISSGIVGGILAVLGSYQGVINASQYLPEHVEPIWDLSWWAGQMPLLSGAFLLKGIDLILLGITIALIGGLASYYMQRDRKFWQNVIGMIFAFWMRFIAIESAKVLIEPGKSVTLWSPLIFYTVAGICTTILSVVVVYRRRRNLPFVE
ncbi:MAG: DUF373 family protein [Candidatus Bathyarchaeia archaeon]